MKQRLEREKADAAFRQRIAVGEDSKDMSGRIDKREPFGKICGSQYGWLGW